MTLIIAEKPELGRAIAAAIPGSGRTEQAVIYKGEYAVIWAYGHLLTLKEPEDYDAVYKRWSLKALPIFFPDWGQKPDKQGGSRTASKSDWLRQIGELLKQCDSVIHVGDPDDEGQYLIDEILRWHCYRGPVKRMNTNDTTPAALGLVLTRDRAIEGHVKQNYYEVVTELDVENRRIEVVYTPKKDDPNLEDGRILDRRYAEEKEKLIQSEPSRKVKVSRKEAAEQPPLPFNLTELQSYCSSRFEYEPTEVLNITQSLRDKHNAITYNRSNCQYLSEERYKTAPATMKTVCRNIAYKPKELDLSLHSRCFDDSRISAHTAIIPQNTAVDLDKLTERERKVYLAICKYYMAQFLPPAKKAQTSLVSPLPDGGTLKASATEIIKPGWMALFKNDKAAGLKEEKNGPLSTLAPGTYPARLLGTRIDEKLTKPPARYTKASLGKDMTRIARYVTLPGVQTAPAGKGSRQGGRERLHRNGGDAGTDHRQAGGAGLFPRGG